jgi:hypothetical protein
MELHTRPGDVVLQILREDDERNGAMRSHAIIDNDPAKSILVVLSSRRVSWEQPKREQPPLDGHVGDLWDWAYQGMMLMPPAIAEDAGVGPAITEGALRVIKAARMIFPDGTPSKWARAIIEAEVADRVRKLRGPKK